MDNGFKKVTILGAENRIGGRNHTKKFSKYYIIVFIPNELNLLPYVIFQKNT